MAGQTDRFGQPIPAAPGYQTILNPDGTQPQMRNVLYLGDGFTAVDEPNSEATRLNVDITIAGSVQQVDGVTNLRNDLFLLGPNVDKIYVTKNYYTSTDAGGWSYRWNASDTATDDGVLHIKNSHHATGRFQPIRPSDGYINAQATGPALADIGSITRSFDPTGVRAISTEFERITGILRNNDWAGIEISPDNAGNHSYKIHGDERIAASSVAFVPFHVKGVGFVDFFLDPASGNSYDQGIGCYVAPTSGPEGVYNPGYNSRYWTQTIGGGENVFPGVANIVGLAVGDWVLCRIGAEITDASGWWASWFIGQVKAITPGAGTTGTVETWQSVREATPVGVGLNPLRIQTKHDMIKLTGFQDGTKITGLYFDDIFVAPGYFRNMVIDECWWLTTMNFCINGGCGIGLEVPHMYVSQARGSTIVAGNLITLVSNYDSHFGSIVINDIRPLAGAQVQVLTEESSCRGTRVDYAGITYNAGTAFGGFVIFAGQTPGQTDIISVGHLTISGMYGQFVTNNGVHYGVIDIQSATSFILNGRIDAVDCIIFKGKIYKQVVSSEYTIPLGPSGTFNFNLPIHGLTRSLKMLASSATGITSVLLSTDNFATSFEVVSEIATGAWTDIADAASCGISRPNSVGYNALQIRVVTNGSATAGQYIALNHSCFEIDLSTVVTAVPDTSIPHTLVTSGAPSSNSSFLSQEAFDSTNSVWYKSVATGTGASDWKPAGAGGAIQAGTAALGSLVFTNIAAPATPSAGKIVGWCDSTTLNWQIKDQFGNVSCNVFPTSAAAHNWVRGVSAAGSLLVAQPSSVDLSDLAPVALTDADATIAVSGGSYYSLAASTLTGLHTLTLGNTSATDKQAIQVRVFSQGSNYLINDSAATLLLSVSSGTKVVATFVWATATSKFQLQSWNFFT